MRWKWRRLSFAEAEAVARAIVGFAETGVAGFMVYVDGEYLLFVGELAVVMLIDGHRIYVDRVRHA